MSWGKLTRCSLSHTDIALKDRDRSALGWSCSGLNWLVSVTTARTEARGTSAPRDRGEDRHLVVVSRLPAQIAPREQIPVEKESVHLPEAAAAVEQHRPQGGEPVHERLQAFLER